MPHRETRAAALSAPEHLRSEFQYNPLGLTCTPRFSWRACDTRPAEIQSGYEISVASSPDQLEHPDLWHSTPVFEDFAGPVAYKGAALTSGQKAWWRVRTYDSDGIASPWSAAAWFEMGLLEPSARYGEPSARYEEPSARYGEPSARYEEPSARYGEPSAWTGDWLSSPMFGSLNQAAGAASFRRAFQLTHEVVTARLYVAALGDARVSLNGDVLSSASTLATADFRHRANVQVLDVTASLQVGDNVLELRLGDGYFSGQGDARGREMYGRQPAVRAVLKMQNDQGAELIIPTDSRWRWRPCGHLRAEPVGECLDLRQRAQQSSLAGVDDAAWLPCEKADVNDAVTPVDGIVLDTQQELKPLHPPMKRHADVLTHGDFRPRGERVVATCVFGEHIVGRARVAVRGRAADRVIVRYSPSEDFANASVDEFTIAGSHQEEVLEGEFALHSFKSVEIEYTAGEVVVDSVAAVRIGAGNLRGLALRSDHATLNELVTVCNSSLRACALSAPVRGIEAIHTPDWGYAQTWVPYLLYDPDAYPVVHKWLDDALLSFSDHQTQGSYGTPRIPVAQDTDLYARFESLVEITWATFLGQRDLDLLRAHYPVLRATALGYKHMFPGMLREQPRPDLYGEGLLGRLTATASVYRALRKCIEIAGMLGHPADAELIENVARSVRDAFRSRFLTADGHLVNESRSACVMALSAGLVEDHEIELAEENLIERLIADSYQVDVVPIALSSVLGAITRAGRLDVAYMVLLQTTPASWLGQVRKGQRVVARTDVADIAQAGLLKWLVEEMVGLKFASSADSSQHLHLKPRPPFGQGFQAGSPIRFLAASFESLYGSYEVEWEIGEREFHLYLTLPPSTVADVELPDGVVHSVLSGEHHFSMDFSRGGDGVPTLVQVAGS